jgi:hypothetical protein
LIHERISAIMERAAIAKLITSAPVIHYLWFGWTSLDFHA